MYILIVKSLLPLFFILLVDGQLSEKDKAVCFAPDILKFKLKLKPEGKRKSMVGEIPDKCWLGYNSIF